MLGISFLGCHLDRWLDNYPKKRCCGMKCKMVLADAGPWKKIRGCSCDGLCFSEVSIRLVQGLLRDENNVSVVPNAS